MKRHRLTVSLFSFLMLILIGIVCSNMQSQLANQILQARGMSMEARIVKPKKDVEIKTVLRWIKKKYPHDSVQMQLQNKYEKKEVLIWAQNRNLHYFPVTQGRFFTSSDFTGRVTFAALAASAEVPKLTTQGNTYVVLGGHYYSVVGTLKRVPYQGVKTFYLTTGPNQETAKDSISDYVVYVDGSKSAISHIATYLQSKTWWPDFVKRNRQRRLTLLMPEALLILFLTLIAMAAMALDAWLLYLESRRTHITGDLLTNFILNKSGRFLFFQVLEGVGAYILLVWRAYIGHRGMLAMLLIGVVLLEVCAYIGTLLYIYNHGEKIENA